MVSSNSSLLKNNLVLDKLNDEMNINVIIERLRMLYIQTYGFDKKTDNSKKFMTQFNHLNIIDVDSDMEESD